MSLGEQLIRELKRRRMLGSFFSYKAYRELRSIASAEELSAFLERHGLPDVQTHGSVADIIDRLRERQHREARRSALPELLEPVLSLAYHLF